MAIDHAVSMADLQTTPSANLQINHQEEFRMGIAEVDNLNAEKDSIPEVFKGASHALLVCRVNNPESPPQ
jgi:hypothetical protein